jgi:hypothetical protein
MIAAGLPAMPTPFGAGAESALRGIGEAASLPAPSTLRPAPAPLMPYSLILVHRTHYQAVQDLVEIAALVHRLAPDIEAYVVSDEAEDDVTRDRAARHPTLLVSFGEIRTFKPAHAKAYCGRFVPKHRQLIRLSRAGVPVPRSYIVGHGFPEDVPRFSDLMVVKQSAERSSRGEGVILVRYERMIEKLKEVVNDKKWQYPIILQEFVRTGPTARHTRVQTFMGRPILTWTSMLKEPLPDGSEPDSVIESAVIAGNTPGAPKDRDMSHDAEKFALAARTFEVFNDIPLHGVDIVTTPDGRHLVLEMNGGGNTWHFSSAGGPRIRASFGGREGMMGQLDAWRVIAEELVRRTRAEAA